MNENLRDAVLASAQNGMITTQRITGLGLNRAALKELVDRGDLIRCSRGIYMQADEWEDEFYLL